MVFRTALCIVLLTFVVTAIGQSNVGTLIRRARLRDPEIFLKAPEKAAMLGYNMETHHVQTEDGYILGVHRIPGRKTLPPILMYHGLLSHSGGWIAFGHRRSLAYQLADSGYDIWMGNARGNQYSRNHTRLKPTERAFWKFSWHDMGMYDLPATVDYILNTTGHEQLIYIGHSMGNTMAYVMLTMRPEYNSKIRLMVNLSPAIFLKHMTSRVGLALLKNRAVFKGFMDSTTGELFPTSEAMLAVGFYLHQGGAAFDQTFKNVMMELCGFTDGLDTTDLPAVASIGSGTSILTLWQFFQNILAEKFQQFDFGEDENKRRYGSIKPPEYNLKLITAPVAIHYGDTDAIVSNKDVMNLPNVLPNVVEFRRVPAKYFNHLDFVTHIRVKELLNDHLVEYLQQHQ